MKSLDLFNCFKINDDGIGNLPLYLEELNLSGSQITDKGIPSLSNNIVILHLQECNKLTKDCLLRFSKFRKSPLKVHLEGTSIKTSDITDARNKNLLPNNVEFITGKL